MFSCNVHSPDDLCYYMFLYAFGSSHDLSINQHKYVASAKALHNCIPGTPCGENEKSIRLAPHAKWEKGEHTILICTLENRLPEGALCTPDARCNYERVSDSIKGRMKIIHRDGKGWK